MDSGRANLGTLVQQGEIRIWDLPVRLFHWLLVACIAVASITGFVLASNWFQVHVIAGVSAGTLILARLIWGFTGSTYARFSTYALRPADAMRHVRDIQHGVVERDAGHNALGAWMVLALTGVTGVTALSGVAVLGGQFKQGPLKSVLSFATGSSLRGVHELAAILLLVLAGLHIAGVVFESWRTHENLARAMVTGNKKSGLAHVAATVRAKPVLALSSITLLAAVIAGASIWMIAKPPMGVHELVADATWKEECGSCHLAFPPSLLPAASWKGLMSNLADHFGEDASLGDGEVRSIGAFLVANAAETQDSLPANQFRSVDPARPFEITATPFWLHMHADIPEKAFAQKSVGAKQNCAACHSDAETTALFAPQHISIPKE